MCFSALCRHPDFSHLLLSQLGSLMTTRETFSSNGSELLTETRNGDAAAVLGLLEAGADPNINSPDLGSPLFLGRLQW